MERTKIPVLGYLISTERHKETPEGRFADVSREEHILNLETGTLALSTGVTIEVNLDEQVVLETLRSKGRTLRILRHSFDDWTNVQPSNGVVLLDQPEEERTVLLLATYRKRPGRVSAEEELDRIFVSFAGEEMTVRLEEKDEVEDDDAQNAEDDEDVEDDEESRLFVGVGSAA